MNKERLEKILLRYSGAATVILGTQAAQGQIVWTDINDTTLNGNNQRYDIDVNNDGEVDFRITQFVDSIVSGDNLTGVQVETFGTAGNQVLGLDYLNYNYPFRLGVGDTIGAGEPFRGLGQGTAPNRFIGYMGLGVNGTTYPNSQFVDTTNGITDGFLGLKFRSDVNDTIRTFYGWLRLDVAADLRSVTIKDYAYESTFNGTIQAGYGSPIGIEEVEIERPELVQRGKFLDIELPEGFISEGEVKFFDLGGKSISEITIDSSTTRIPLENMPKGMMVAVCSSNGMDTSKKVLVY